METGIEIRSIGDVYKTAEIMIASGYFQGVKDVAQGAVKIMAGRELGIPPVAAMRGIDIVEGQISIRAHLMGGMIKRSSRYNYKVKENSAERCIILFYDNGEEAGTSEFTMDEAKQAGLVDRKTRDGRAIDGAWKKFPKAMLYNRAMSQGARMFCPDIFYGGVYDEGEIEPRNQQGPPPAQTGRTAGLIAEAVVGESGNWTGDVSIEQPLEEDDIPEPTPEPMPEDMPEDMTEPQRKKILGLFAKGGILDGDKRELLDRLEPSKRTASVLIEDLMQTTLNEDPPKLPNGIMYYYVNMLRERYGIDVETIADYCAEYFNGAKVSSLSGDQQTQLIAWLSMASEYETDEEDAEAV